MKGRSSGRKKRKSLYEKLFSWVQLRIKLIPSGQLFLGIRNVCLSVLFCCCWPLLTIWSYRQLTFSFAPPSWPDSRRFFLLMSDAVNVDDASVNQSPISVWESSKSLQNLEKPPKLGKNAFPIFFWLGETGRKTPEMRKEKLDFCKRQRRREPFASLFELFRTCLGMESTCQAKSLTKNDPHVLRQNRTGN